jgi:hypothetical protein
MPGREEALALLGYAADWIGILGLEISALPPNTGTFSLKIDVC